MLASIPSATVLGVRGSPVTVEVFVGDGLPGYHMVGMPDTACRESRDRVRAAVLSGGFAWPTRCITVNLAPTSQRKSGAGLDLAIAVGLLVASGQLPVEAVEGIAFLGELGLDGTIRRVPGVAPMVDALDDIDVVVPAGNVVEAQIAARGQVRTAPDLASTVACLSGARPWDVARPDRCRRRLATAARSERRPRPGRRQAGTGDRRRGWPPPTARRVAGQRQDDAGSTPRRRAPATRPRAGAGDHDGPFGGRATTAPWRPRAPATVSCSPPHDVRGRTGRRRLASAASWGSLPRHQWSVVHGRARRIWSSRFGRSPRTARGGRHPRGASGDPHGHAGQVPACRRHQSVPVRRRPTRLVRVRRRLALSLSASVCPVRSPIASTCA